MAGFKYDDEIQAIMDDPTLPMIQKLQKKQAIANKRTLAALEIKETEDVPAELDRMVCSFCLSLLKKPVTGACQHSYCLDCFNRWVKKECKHDCPECRKPFPKAMIKLPRINCLLSNVIRRTREPAPTTAAATSGRSKIDEDRPDTAFRSDRAVRKGLSNASCGRRPLTCGTHHFGEIGPEFDPEQGRGVQVGDTFSSRMEVSQRSVHPPHVSGISGMSQEGAWSVVLSGLYADDVDHGNYVLYTGSGGRDLSGNKRTSKHQTSNQKFTGANLALRVSCEKGLPLRVIRTWKDKHSPYAPGKTPEDGFRFDGLYHVVAAWQQEAKNELVVCRYLLRRCDNAPAPWSDSTLGDPAPETELPDFAKTEITKSVGDVVYMTEHPCWAYSEAEQKWVWAKNRPVLGQKRVTRKAEPTLVETLTNDLKEAKKALDELKCDCCSELLRRPVCTPCAHNFCESCLTGKFEAAELAVPKCSARQLRNRKLTFKCPCVGCKADLVEFMTMYEVNLAVVEQIPIRAKLVEELHGKLDAERARAENEKPLYAEEEDDTLWPTSAATAVGWRVEVWWYAEEDWFAGAVSGVDGEDWVVVSYDDGDEQTLDFSELKVRWMKKVPKPVADAAGSSEAGPSSSVVPRRIGSECLGLTEDEEKTVARAKNARKQKEQALADAAACEAQSKKEALFAQYGEMVDHAVIEGMLSDQGGDCDVVADMLKSFAKQVNQASCAQSIAVKKRGRKRSLQDEVDPGASSSGAQPVAKAAKKRRKKKT